MRIRLGTPQSVTNEYALGLPQANLFSYFESPKMTGHRLKKEEPWGRQENRSKGIQTESICLTSEEIGKITEGK